MFLTRSQNTIIKATRPSPLLSAGVVVGALLFLVPPLFLPQGVPVWHNGDQNLFLLNASRMLQGQLIYRDFFHFLLPGTETVFVLLFKVFGERAWIPNVTLIVLGSVQTWLIVWMSFAVLKGSAAVVTGLLFLVGAYRNVLDATHHWFSATVALATIVVIFERRTAKRLVIAGVLCGVAAFFTSARGLACILGLTVFLIWEHLYDAGDSRLLLRKLASLFLAFAATMAVICGYLTLKVGFRVLWDSVVEFPVRYYPTGRANTFRAYMSDWPGLASWTHVPTVGAWILIYALLPLAYILFLIRYRRERVCRSSEPWKQLMMLNIIGCFLFCGVLSAPGFVRLCSVSLPALVLSVWVVGTVNKHGSVLMKLLAILLLGLAAVEPWPIWLHHSFVLNLPAGRVGFRGDRGSNDYAWLLQQTHPPEYLFDSAARVYFPLHLTDPSKIPFIANTGYTTGEQVQNVVHSLEAKRIRFVFWRRFLDIPESRLDAGDNLGPLREYLSYNYHVTHTFSSGDNILERNEHAP
jgi:hypothetical protein